MANQKEFAPTKCMVGEVRFSYANVFTPQSINGSVDLKYSIVLLIPKTNKALVAKIQAAIKAAETDAIPKVWKGAKPNKSFKMPLHDGDEEKPDNEEYAGHYYMNASNKSKPGILVREDGNNNPLTQQSDFYSGCYGHATVNFFGFDNKSKGIGCSLQNLIKTRDGAPLSGKASAEDDFSKFEDENEDMY